jgi:POT family proton-dependent oligopeptide transporter
MGEYLTAPAPTKEMPKGIPYIIGNEAAERFSFYGMKAILFTFMTQYLLNSSGEPAYFTETEARQYQAWFTSAAYFTPLVGAFIADALWGKYKTILYISLFYCLGHGTLALLDMPEPFLQATLEPTNYFFIGLVLLAIGSGGIKSCVSANVGDQFGQTNKHLLSRVYSWFYFSINFGSFFSTMLTPWLLDVYGPGVAFGVPGVLMALATVVFWMGRRKFVHVPPVGTKVFLRNMVDRDGRSAILRLTPIFLLVAVFWSCYDQSTSGWVGQATRMDRLLGTEWYESQIQAINPLLVLLFIPLFQLVLYPLGNKLWTLTPLRKIGIGMFLTAVTFGFSAVIEQWTVDSRETFDREHAARIEAGEGDLRATLAHLEANSRPKAARALLEDHFGRDNVKLYASADAEISVAKWNLDALAAIEMRFDALESEAEASGMTAGALGARKVELRDDLTAALREQRPIVLGPGEIADAQAESAESPEHWFASGGVVYKDASAHMFERPNIAWQLLAYVLLTAAEVMVYLTLLEYSYRQAPNSIKSLIMGCNMASVGLGNAFIALVNMFTADAEGNSTLVGASYYWFFTACMLGAALLYVGVAVVYKPKEYLQTESA